MLSAKTKVSKKGERHSIPEDVTKLIEVIIGEIQSPIDTQHLFENFPPTTNCSKEANQFLKAKDRAQRREAFIKTEPRWFRKYGWFMARVVTVFGLLVIVFAVIVGRSGVDFITSMILGAASYYLLLVTLSNLRYRDKNKKRLRLLEREAQSYQRDIVSVASSLLKRFQIDPSRYPVANPKSRAGLEQREDGYYIPVD
jgi:hypothetical protein